MSPAYAQQDATLPDPTITILDEGASSALNLKLFYKGGLSDEPISITGQIKPSDGTVPQIITLATISPGQNLVAIPVPQGTEAITIAGGGQSVAIDWADAVKSNPIVDYAATVESGPTFKNDLLWALGASRSLDLKSIQLTPTPFE